jgi:hypothetical protein
VITGSCILFALGCRGNEPTATTPSASSSLAAATTPEPSTSAPAATLEPTTGDDARLPLYGFHIRRVPGVPQPKAERPRRHEWFLEFPEHLRWKGVLEISYEGRHLGVLWGRAYRYTADLATHSLRLVAPTQKRGRLRLGGFACRPDEPATYMWSRFERNYVLRLSAVQERCAARRAILEGDWHFID